ncbi:MAG: DegQ family serine endoprotease [Rhodospirillales bacterium]
MKTQEYANRGRTAGRVAAVVAVLAIAGGAVAIGASNALTAGTAPAAAAVAGSALPVSFAGMIEKVGPAVVNIRVEAGDSATPARMDPREFRGPKDMPEFFRRFFGDEFEKRFGGDHGRRSEQHRMQAMGSGFIIDKKGYIVTNDHVVRGAEKIVVTLKNGAKHEATLIGRDRKTDLALIKIETDQDLPFVPFGNSDAARVGDWVVAVGNPFGLDHTVTAGIISARGRAIGNGPYDDFLQIDAPINKGNSGGPAFNLRGEVIGVNTAIFSPTGGSVGIGFAIPSSLAQKVIVDLKDDGTVERGWLGVNIQGVNKDMAASLNLDKARGAIVSRVIPDSPAAEAGLEQGDVILAVDGRPVRTVRDLPRLIAGIDGGKSAKLAVWRDGREKTVRVRIGRMPESMRLGGTAEAEVQGMRLSSLDPAVRRAYRIGDDIAGVVVTAVAADSWAAKKGLTAGDVIVAVGNAQVSTPADVAAGIRQARQQRQKAVLLLINREAQERFVALPLKAA